MFTNFSEAERTIHYPADRRRFIGVKPAVIVICIILWLVTIGVAWLQYLVFGLPSDPSLSLPAVPASSPTGFPWWLRLSHWITFFFLVLIIRSGLSILADHPRLYWNRGCKPHSSWIRFTPIKVPDEYFDQLADT